MPGPTCLQMAGITMMTTRAPATVVGTQRPTTKSMPHTTQKMAVPRRLGLVRSVALRMPA